MSIALRYPGQASSPAIRSGPHICIHLCATIVRMNDCRPSHCFLACRRSYDNTRLLEVSVKWINSSWQSKVDRCNLTLNECFIAQIWPFPMQSTNAHATKHSSCHPLLPLCPNRDSVFLDHISMPPERGRSWEQGCSLKALTVHCLACSCWWLQSGVLFRDTGTTPSALRHQLL